MFSLFFITMISAAIVKVSALGGIALVWWEFTCEAIKLAKKIILPPEEPPKYQCEYCGYFFTGDFVSDRRGVNCHFQVCKHCEEKEDVCERCGERFVDDEALYGEEKNENPLCKICI